MKQFLKPAQCAILVSVLFFATLFTGCGKKADTPDNSTETASVSSQTAESSAERSSASSQTAESSTESPSASSQTVESSTESPPASSQTVESSMETGATSAPAQTDGSSAEEETDRKESETTEAPAETHQKENWSEYDNEAQGWGQGVHFNSKNQPEGSLSYQKKYGSYDAHFIGSDTDDKVIWLTLDEGYENGYTSEILDVLKEKNCQAVFFITGSYAKENPALINRMIDEGHVIGNHSWSHPSKGMPSLSVDEQIADITKLHDYVKKHYNYEMTLFRNPAGIFSERSLAVTRSLGYDSMFWSFAYADWDPASQPDPQESLQKLVDRLHPGALYLLHAVSETNTEILGDFIDQARSQGYEFRLP